MDRHLTGTSGDIPEDVEMVCLYQDCYKMSDCENTLKNIVFSCDQDDQDDQEDDVHTYTKRQALSELSHQPKFRYEYDKQLKSHGASVE